MTKKKSIFELAENNEKLNVNEKSCFDKIVINNKKNKQAKKQKRNEEIKNGIKKQKLDECNKNNVHEKDSKDKKNKDKESKLHKREKESKVNEKDIKLHKREKESKLHNKDKESKLHKREKESKLHKREKDRKNKDKKNKDKESKLNEKESKLHKNNKDKESKVNEKDKGKKNKDKKTKKEETIGIKLSTLEKEILHKGTLKDKINLLTLITEKNPSDFNYKNLLFYAENQRNDVIYLVLKNIKDLIISKGVPNSIFIKQKITKCLEINVKNSFIKTKIIRLIYDLLKNNILFDDLIYTFINKIGDKKEIETYVRENLMSLFFINEESILYNVEDFIFKNTNFKCINSILKFLGLVTPTVKSKSIELYKIILENLHEFKEEQKNIILENCLDQLCSCLEEIEDPSKFYDNKFENILRNNCVNDKIAFYSVKIFYTCRSEIIKPFIVQLLKNHFFFNSKNLKCIFQFIEKIYNKDKDNNFLIEVFNTSVFYKKDFLIAVLSIIIKNRLSNLQLLEIVKNHYSFVVRKMVKTISKKEYDKIEIDPFDKIQIEAYEKIFNKI